MRRHDRRIGALMAANARPDTPEEVADRLRRREAADAAVADRMAAFPTLTADNAAAAVKYQDERIRFHEVRLGVRGAR